MASKAKFPNLRLDRYKVVRVTLCGIGSEKFHKPACIKRERGDCGVGKLSNHMEPLLETYGDTEIAFSKWISVKSKNKQGKDMSKPFIQTLTSTLHEMVEELKEVLNTLSLHLFHARWQQVQF